jgi:lysophospholipase L1-like esterase
MGDPQYIEEAPLFSKGAFFLYLSVMHTLLSLGDSYTIGEGVPLYDSFPYQTVQYLRRTGHCFQAPEIIARTGWATDELSAGINRFQFLPPYTVVTLLIGVNNQYRGRTVGEYAEQFRQLMAQAIDLAGTPLRVFVLSIPDWGVAPFAAANGQDSQRIALEIDNFNATAREVTLRAGSTFIDITTHGRTIGGAKTAFAADGLHPAPQTYRHWAQLLVQAVAPTLPQ